MAAAGLALTSSAVATPVQFHPNVKTPSEVYPNIADITHATPSLVDFCHSYFTAKSLQDLDAFVGYFTPTTQNVYFDATIGLAVSQANLAADLKSLLNASTTDGKSYPLRIIGDFNSAVVLSVDTPGLFGPVEARSISAVDFTDGKAARWIDYWDGRLNPQIDERTPDDQFPTSFGESKIKKKRNPAIQNAATKLHTALSTGDSTAAAGLFAFDAVFEDMATNTRLEGRASIKAYLQRALPSVPYGVDATVRHIVGGVQGGAYEWIGAPGAVSRNGITALELNYHGEITRLTTVWDTSRASNATLVALTGLAIGK